MIGPGQTHQYQILFSSYATAAIGYQSTSLPVGVRLIAPNGNVLMQGREVAGRYVWNPTRNQAVKAFTIRVHNPHNRQVVYRLFTN